MFDGAATCGYRYPDEIRSLTVDMFVTAMVERNQSKCVVSTNLMAADDEWMIYFFV